MAKKKLGEMIDLDGPAGSTVLKNFEKQPDKSMKRTTDIELVDPDKKKKGLAGLGKPK